MSEWSIDARDFLRDLRVLKSDLHKEAHNAMQECVKEAERSAKATTLYNDRNGILRLKTKGIVTSSLTGELRADTSYAAFIENGTRPHLIQGNPNLQFTWKGERVNFRYVNHPGTAARPFMQIAGEWGGHVLHDSLSAFTADAINKFNS